MQREESDLVRHLYRLFLAYDGVEARAAAGELPAGERDELVGGLGRVAAACWRGLFGAALETPAHKQLVATWCLRNAELLMKEQVLPVIAHQVIASRLQQDLAGLEAGDPGYDFTRVGPQDAIGQALRRVYLIQSLVGRVEELAVEGQIPAKLQLHLRKHLVARVKTVFAQMMGEPDEAGREKLPPLARVLEPHVSRGLVTAQLAARLVAGAGEKASTGMPSGKSGVLNAAELRAAVDAAGTASAPSVPRPAFDASGSQRMPVEPVELTELAAAGELIRRLRRQPSLSQDERDRLMRRIETEMEDLLEKVGPRRLDRALAALGERLGIPVPPPPSAVSNPGSRSGSVPRPQVPLENPASRLLPAPKAAKAAPVDPSRSGDSSDFQWAFDLIDELRRENAEGGSSGK